MAFAAAEGEPDHTAGEGHVEAVTRPVQVQRQDPPVVLLTGGAPAGDGKRAGSASISSNISSWLPNLS